MPSSSPCPPRVVFMRNPDLPTASRLKLETVLPQIVVLGMTQESLSFARLIDPHVVIVDLQSCEPRVVRERIECVRAHLGSARLIALCDTGDQAAMERALTQGAAACLSGLTDDPMVVLRAVNDVARGRMHLGATGQRAIRALMDPKQAVAD